MSRRVAKEYKEWIDNKSDYPYIHDINIDPSDAYKYSVKMKGPEDPESPYNGGIFTLSYSYPHDYPFSPPKVHFITKVYHPNVKTSTGEICLDTIKEKWSPALNLLKVVLSIQSLLTEPNPDSPLESMIAEEYANNRTKYNKQAADYTKKYAVL